MNKDTLDDLLERLNVMIDILQQSINNYEKLN